MKSKPLSLALVLLLLAVLMAACGGGDDDDASLEATADALRTSLASEAATPVPEVTPEPVEEAATEAQPAEADDGGPVATAAAEATARSNQATVTAAAQAAANTAAAEATAAAVAPILAELPTYGVDPNAGRIAWIHPQLDLDVSGYLQYDYGNRFLATLARDFVIGADITWNTLYGTTGCGYAVRSDGDEEDPNQYIFVATRGGSGHVLFGIQRDGEVNLNEVVDVYARGKDPLFQWQNDTTNHFVIVGRGDQFDIYTNGTYLGTINGQAGYLEGFVAFLALNESGNTHCRFDNGYLFVMN